MKLPQVQGVNDKCQTEPVPSPRETPRRTCMKKETSRNQCLSSPPPHCSQSSSSVKQCNSNSERHGRIPISTEGSRPKMRSSGYSDSGSSRNSTSPRPPFPRISNLPRHDQKDMHSWILHERERSLERLRLRSSSSKSEGSSMHDKSRERSPKRGRISCEARHARVTEQSPRAPGLNPHITERKRRHSEVQPPSPDRSHMSLSHEYVRQRKCTTAKLSASNEESDRSLGPGKTAKKESSRNQCLTSPQISDSVKQSSSKCEKQEQIPSREKKQRTSPPAPSRYLGNDPPNKSRPQNLREGRPRQQTPVEALQPLCHAFFESLSKAQENAAHYSLNGSSRKSHLESPHTTQPLSLDSRCTSQPHVSPKSLQPEIVDPGKHTSEPYTTCCEPVADIPPETYDAQYFDFARTLNGQEFFDEYEYDYQTSTKWECLFEKETEADTVLVSPLPILKSVEDVAAVRAELEWNATCDKAVCESVIIYHGRSLGTSSHFACVKFSDPGAAASWCAKNNNHLYLVERHAHQGIRKVTLRMSSNTKTWVCSSCKTQNFSQRVHCHWCFANKNTGKLAVTMSPTPTRFLGLRTFLLPLDAILASIEDLRCVWGNVILEKSGLPLGICVLEFDSKREANRWRQEFVRRGRQSIFLAYQYSMKLNPFIIF